MIEPLYFTPVGNFHAHDPEPDLEALTAKISFTPVLRSGELIRATTVDPPTGFHIPAVTGVIDSDGQVKLKKQLPGEVMKFVRLVADQPLLELDGPLCYRVDFTNVRFGKRSASVNSFVIQAPTTDIELDLITADRVATQAAGPGSFATVLTGPPGPPGPPGELDLTGLQAELQTVLQGIGETGGVVGPQGPPGEKGTEWWFGEGPPDYFLGSRPGDVYMDTLTGQIYKLGD